MKLTLLILLLIGVVAASKCSVLTGLHIVFQRYHTSLTLHHGSHFNEAQDLNGDEAADLESMELEETPSLRALAKKCYNRKGMRVSCGGRRSRKLITVDDLTIASKVH